MIIGIIGAENSHTAAIAQTINVKKQLADCSVDYVWGETRAFAEAAAEKGQIPHIVECETDMLGKIDALIVDHRHPKYHLPAALPYVKAGVPTFIDKPFCYRAAEGWAFLDTAHEAGAPVTSFSVLPHQKSFRDLQSNLTGIGPLKAFTSYGPADLESPYGGIFFYGIHQVEYVLQAVGYDVEAALCIRNGSNGLAQLFYADGRIAALHLVQAGCPGFFAHAVGEQGETGIKLAMDENPYLEGIKTFTAMFKTGKEPVSRDRIMRPVEVLEALERSLSSGRRETVGRQ